MIKLVAAAALLAASPAVAEGAKAVCIPIATAQKSASDHNEKWIEMSTSQWEFLRGVAVVNPATPPGLPPGKTAVLVKSGESGTIVFIDGERACTPMDAPKQLIDLLDAVAKDVITHEGNDL